MTAKWNPNFCQQPKRSVNSFIIIIFFIMLQTNCFTPELRSLAGWVWVMLVTSQRLLAEWCQLNCDHWSTTVHHPPWDDHPCENNKFKLAWNHQWECSPLKTLTECLILSLIAKNKCPANWSPHCLHHGVAPENTYPLCGRFFGFNLPTPTPPEFQGHQGFK